MTVTSTLTQTLRGSARLARRWGPKAGFSILDQGVVSGANFILNLLLARWVAPAEYGAFAVGFAVFLFAAGFHNVLILEPMSVLGPVQYPGHFRDSMALVLRIHLGLTIGMTPFLIAAGAFASDASLRHVLWTLALTMPVILLFWLLRRAYYVMGQPASAAMTGLCYAISLLCVVIGLRSFGALSAPTALLAMGAASCLASSFAWLRAGYPIRAKRVGSSHRGSTDIFLEYLTYGRWLVLDAILYQATSQVQVFCAATIAGLAASGALGAMQTFALPMVQIIVAISTLMLPMLSRDYGNGSLASVQRTSRLLTLFLLGITVPYEAVLIVGSRSLERILYGGKFAAAADLIPILGILPIVLSFSAGSGLILRVARRTKSVLLCDAIAAPVGVVSAIILTAAQGARGAALSLVVTSATVAVAQWFLARRALRTGSSVASGRDRENRWRQLPAAQHSDGGSQRATMHGPLTVWRTNHRLRLSLLVSAGLPLALICGLLIALIPSWSMAIVIATVIAICVVPTVFDQRISTRIVTFFSLLAIGDFAKRLTFIVDGQSVWSQYLVLLIPTAYFALFIALPWFLSRGSVQVSNFERVTVCLLVVILLNTWLAPQFSLLAKVAATGLLILPWSMILVAVSYRQSVYAVARTLAVWGVLSALYGVWQFIFGPTPVEKNWAAAAGRISVGASKLADAQNGLLFQGDFWRVNGLQSDAFTFGIFLMTAFAAAWYLRAMRKLSNITFFCIALTLMVGMSISVVRTIWLSFAAMIAFTLAAKYFRFLINIRWLAVVFVCSFFIMAFGANYLPTTYGNITGSNAIETRALTFGTLEARQGALHTFVETLPSRLLFGYGYGAARLLSGKVSDDSSDVLDATKDHNAIVVLLQYFGLPGLILFIMLLYTGLGSVERVLHQESANEGAATTILCSYLLGMFISGCANGDVYLNYYFFFFFGVIATAARHTLAQVEIVNKLTWSRTSVKLRPVARIAQRMLWNADRSRNDRSALKTWGRNCVR